jgi:hypothetical protein
MEKSKELGAVDAEAVEQGARLATSVNESKVAWEGLKNILTDAFGPLLTEIVDGFISLVEAMKQSYESGGAVKQHLRSDRGCCRRLRSRSSALSALAISEFFSIHRLGGISVIPWIKIS